MKQIIFCAFIATFCCIVGCEEPVIDNVQSTPIKLNTWSLQLNVTDKTVGHINILSGNGEYRIVYPKMVSIVRDRVAFSKEIFNIEIKNDNLIVVERKLLDELYVSGLFMVEDSKGEREIFCVGVYDPHSVTGIFTTYDDIKNYMNHPDYWQ